ncbi:diacylglycerol kinase family protein [Citricoccus nitrophenolicus]|uniref:Diacylglycerol kinase family protein n=1 Tax=Citricoccus nitrophenolicus TaxID=863575 RepID=A0ABV0ILY6_9MICC
MSHPAGGRPHLLLCINPASGVGRGAGIGAEVLARLRSGGADVEVLAVHRESLHGSSSRVAGGPTPDADDELPARRYETALGRRLDGGPQPAAVVVVGGDGMVHVTANVLAGTGIPLGVVPAGTGNDTVRALGWAEAGVAESTERILGALGRPPGAIDLARVELGDLGAAGAGAAGGGTAVVRYAVSGVNVAFDAAVNATANSLRWPRGGLRYVLAVLMELTRYRPAGLRTLLDGAEGASGPAFLLCVMNGRFIGGGMEVTPGTRLDDGILEVFHVPPMHPVRFLRVFPRVFSGRHTDLPEVTIRPARSVRIERVGRGPSERESVVFGDGEPLGQLPATVTVAPGMLAVLGGAES